MKRYPSLLQPEPVSQAGTGHSDFEFPTATSDARPNDVVFCGKVISRQTEPSRINSFAAWMRSPSGRENRYRRIDGGSRRHYNGMFGTVKFPLQMELSDMKMRQERREPMPLPKIPVMAEIDVGGSRWELVRPLRRRGMLMSALAKASFRCIPIA